MSHGQTLILIPLLKFVPLIYLQLFPLPLPESKKTLVINTNLTKSVKKGKSSDRLWMSWICCHCYDVECRHVVLIKQETATHLFLFIYFFYTAVPFKAHAPGLGHLTDTFGGVPLSALYCSFESFESIEQECHTHCICKIATPFSMILLLLAVWFDFRALLESWSGCF